MDHPTDLPIPATPRPRHAKLSTHVESTPKALTEIPIIDRKVVCEDYANANKRLILLDYDGTLTPIVNDPATALPTDRLILALERLVADAKNKVWIISGRDLGFLERILGRIKQLGLSAEHGCFARDPDLEECLNLAAEQDLGWQPIALAVFNKYAAATAGSWIEEKTVAIAWHYRNSDAEFGEEQAVKCEKELKEALGDWYDAGVVMGKKVVEVRPRLLDKGAIVRTLRERYTSASDDHPDFVLCLGDDATDEDMFKVVNKWGDLAWSCKVGPGEKSHAKYRIGQPTDVEDMLVEMAKQSTN